MSLRDQILTADDLLTEDVEVPEWGATVRIRTLTGEERMDFIKSITDLEKGQVDPSNMDAKLVARSALDPETGERLFTDKHVKQLGMKSSVAIERLSKVARRLSGFGDIEEVAADFGVTQNASSSTD